MDALWQELTVQVMDKVAGSPADVSTFFETYDNLRGLNDLAWGMTSIDASEHLLYAGFAVDSTRVDPLTGRTTLLWSHESYPVWLVTDSNTGYSLSECALMYVWEPSEHVALRTVRMLRGEYRGGILHGRYSNCEGLLYFLGRLADEGTFIADETLISAVEDVVAGMYPR